MKKNIVIILLSIVILGLGGYLVYDKVIDKEESSNEIENKEETFDNSQKDYNIEDAKKLIDRYTLNQHMFYDSIFNDKLDESAKIYIAINNTQNTQKNINCKDYFPDAKYITANNQYEINKSYCTDGMNSNVYSYENLNKTYKELFGNNEDMPKTYSNEVYSRYSYSSKYNEYVSLSCNCGGAGPIDSYYEVTSAKTINDELNIIVKHLEFTYSYSDNYIYQGVKDLYTLDFSNYELANIDMKEVFDKEKDYLPEYKFKFKKEKDSYYLVSIEKGIY